MLLIKDGFVIDPKTGTEGKRDILTDGDRIVKIEPEIDERNIEGGVHVIDAMGCMVTPGLVDTHSHFRDPGQTHKEDIHTGSLAAAKGGYTSIVMMANTKPSIDSVPVLSDVLKRGSREKIHLYSAANVTLAMQGKERTDFAALKKAGAVVFTDDGKPITDAALLKDAMQAAKALDMPVSLHEEDPAFVTNPGVNAGGKAAASLGLAGADRKAEVTLVDRDLNLAVETGCKLCIQHISAAESVELVRQARKQNKDIHAEATPHHFSLTEDAVLSHGTLAKVNPPLRLESDREAILDGIADGTIDIIATDHAPHAKDEKAQEFTKAPSGMIGLETALSLAIAQIVRPGILTLEKMLPLLTVNPAAFYGLPAGSLAVGAPADLLVFDFGRSWTVSEHFASKSQNSPFIGQSLPGVVLCTIAGGRIAYQNEDFR